MASDKEILRTRIIDLVNILKANTSDPDAARDEFALKISDAIAEFHEGGEEDGDGGITQQLQSLQEDLLGLVPYEGAIKDLIMGLFSIYAKSLTTEYIDFKTIPTAPSWKPEPPPWKEGRVYYDEITHAYTVYNDIEGTSLQVGQEVRIRVFNDTPDTILKCKAVTVIGVIQESIGNYVVKIEKAIASNKISALGIIGTTKHDIKSDTFGWVTTDGYIKGIDTTAFTEGATIWLSDLVAGEYLETKPIKPSYGVKIGLIVKSDVEGIILTRITRLSNILLFDELHDTPIDKIGSSLKGLRINVGETEVEYYEIEGAIPEELTGLVDGINKVFFTSMTYIPGRINIFVNGLKEFNFTETTSNSITLSDAPLNNGFIDRIEAIYNKQT